MICLILLYVSDGFNIDITQRSIECFTKIGKKGDSLHLDYEIIDGEAGQIRVTVKEEGNDRLVLTTTKVAMRTDWAVDASENQHDEEERRTYKLCFENTLYRASKVVSFSWHLNQDELLRFAKSGQIEETLKRKVDVLWEEIDTVKDLVHYFGLQQNNQHQTNQDTNARVMWASAFEVVTVLLIATVQVYALKSFLEVRRRV